MTIAWSNRLRLLILALVTIEFLLALGASVGWYNAALNHAADRAEITDLKSKLAEQTSGQTACLKENLNLITWKVQAESMMAQAAGLLNECAKRLPDDPKPRRKDKPARPTSAPSWPALSAETGAPLPITLKRLGAERQIK